MTAGVPYMSAQPINSSQEATTTIEASNSSKDASSTQAAAQKSEIEAKNIDAKKQTSKISNPNAGVESIVRNYFADIPIMAEVSKCESRYRQFNPDGTIFRGIVNNKDVGLMQVNEYYHLKRAKKLNYDLYTIEGNLAYARLLYTEEGVQPWSSSAPCWMKSDVAKAMFNSDNKLAER